MTWQGIDEIIERIAASAGRHAHSLVPAADGDLLLFLFLIAGIGGGFVLGYNFHLLFIERTDRSPR